MAPQKVTSPCQCTGTKAMILLLPVIMISVFVYVCVCVCVYVCMCVCVYVCMCLGVCLYHVPVSVYWYLAYNPVTPGNNESRPCHVFILRA